MRRLALATLLPGILLLAACEGPDPGTPFEPSFGKVASPCNLTPTQDALVAHIDEAIDLLFADRNARKAAHGHIDNILRELCEDPPDYDGARQAVHTFIQQVEGQPADKLEQDAASFAELVTWVIILGENIQIEIPAGAFLPTGGLGIVDLSIDPTLTTRDRGAGVKVEEGAATAPFIVALSRVPDGEIGIGAYQVTPPQYEIATDLSGFTAGSVLVAVCVVTDLMEEGVFDRLLLGHGASAGNTLLARVTGADLPIPCADSGTPYPAAPSLSPASGWIARIASAAGHVARTLFGPEPLQARYFSASGLAGRPISFSPFAPVDPYTLDLTGPDEILVGETGAMVASLTSASPDLMPVPDDPTFVWSSSDAGIATVDADGVVTGVAAGTVVITATYPGLTASAEVTIVAPPRYLTLTLTNLSRAVLAVSDGAASCTVNPDATAECDVPLPWAYVHGDVVTLTASVVTTAGSPWDLVAAGACTEQLHASGDGSMTCTLTMDADKAVSILLTH